jgi:hypothetical protein
MELIKASPRKVQIFDFVCSVQLAEHLKAAVRCYAGPIRRTVDPFRLLLVSIAGWLSQQQRDAIDYLREENGVLREQLGGKRLGLNDDQRRRLAAKAKMLGRRILREVATIVTPETLLIGCYS